MHVQSLKYNAVCIVTTQPFNGGIISFMFYNNDWTNIYCGKQYVYKL
jgi:hypothetical protein